MAETQFDAHGEESVVCLLVDQQDLKILEANRAASLFWGMNGSELEDSTLSDLFSYDSELVVRQIVDNLRLGMHYMLTDKQGSSHFCSLNATQVPDTDNVLVTIKLMDGIFQIGGASDEDYRDLLEQLKEQLINENGIFNLFFNAIPAGLMLVDDGDTVVKANPKALEYWNGTPECFLNRNLAIAAGCHADELTACGNAAICARCKLIAGIHAVLETGEPVPGFELEKTFSSGTDQHTKWFKYELTPVTLLEKKYVLVLIDDITERVLLEKNLGILSFTDELSGLRNRRSIIDMLDAKLEEVKRKKTVVTIAMLDLDNFKKINDKHGHVVGDRIIRTFGSVLKSSMRSVDFIGRYGGEEFLIVLPDTMPEQAAIILERVRQKLLLCSYGIDDLQVTFSGGVISIDEDKAHQYKSAELVNMSDMLMYKAKRLGRNRVIKE